MKSNATVTINAPADMVFLWLEDNDRLKKWVPNIVEDETILDTPDKVGSKFRQVYLERGKEMEMFGELTEYIENERMRLDITGDMFDMDLIYILTPQGPETSQLEQNTTIKFKGLMKFLSPIFSVMAKLGGDKATKVSLDRLKQMAEAEHKNT
ncbi:MAG: hypothetical protein EX271_11295 [Acidimicrobiales bacterium]|nr:hypothetical protein [Hyphomonadaceae bacterium]RZV37974.1 MAG: hypothetical protein EX271_11295 [Acidimicrobiales bacterium]